MAGIFGALAARIEAKTTDIQNLTWSALLGGPNSRSGVSVNLMSALKTSTVLSATRVLAEGIAQPPLRIYREEKSGSKEPAVDHPVYKLLFRRPNDWMTSFELREMMMFHAVLLGNAYAYIGRAGRKVVELIPLVPTLCQVVQDLDYGLTYNVTDMTGNVTRLPRESVMHLRGPSWNGYLGMDAIQLAREAIGLAIATEETHASLHANGAQPGGILSIKGSLDKPAKDRLREAWGQHQEGVRNRFKTAVLDVDATWTPLGMKGVDAEHLSTRAFQIEEICRALRVFPLMVGHSDKTATFASAEAFFLAHVTHSLMPWVRRWEETIERDLLDNEDGLYAKFSLQSLLRGDSASRASFYEKALGGARGETAYMTRNEVRALEDLNPIEGGDVLPQPTAPVAPTPIGGPDNAPAGKSGMTDHEIKLGRVLSRANEGKISTARDHLNDVLSTLPQEAP